MPTICAVIVPAKVLKDGRHKVRISVSHNAETRYIPTDITIDSLREFKNGVIVKRPDAMFLNSKLRALMQRFQDALDNVDYPDCLTCPELVHVLKNYRAEVKHSIKDVCEEYLDVAAVKPSSQQVYLRSWNAIAKVLNPNMPLEKLGYANVMALDRAFRRRGLSPSTIGNIMVLLRSVINYAKRCGYVGRGFDPFDGYHAPPKVVRDAWLSMDEIRAIRDVELPKNRLAFHRDLFMLSYYLGGINMIDLVQINFNKHPHSLKYEREKTKGSPKVNRYVQFDIPEEAKAIIARIKGKDGYLDVSKHVRLVNAHDKMSFYMRELRRILGIDKLIFYSARKSFSQHAFTLGVSTSIIDYILGHKLDNGGTSLYSYISVTPDMATKAIRMVLDELNKK